jgi:predicted nucleic acid-binding protein
VSFLLDTNVLSEARKPDRDPNLQTWLASVPPSDLYVSVLAVGEIRQGVERLRRRDPHQAAVYEAWLEVLHHSYRDRLIPITTSIAEEWGRLNVPDPIAAVDGLMAATAKVHDLTFVTRNVADARRTGARVLNPFKPATERP